MTIPPNKPSDLVKADLAIANQEAADWFAKLRNPSISETERRQFQSWLEQSPVHLQAYNNVQEFWDNQALEHALLALPSSNKMIWRLFSSQWQLKLAIPLVTASLVLGVVLFRPNWQCLHTDYCTGVGETRNINLADGSVVTLNSQSAINIRYQDTLRRVELAQGEAMFEVKRNPAQPFVVTAQYSQTKVLGTRFTVRKDKYADTVTVLHGIVAVNGNRQKMHILHDNDQLILGENRIGNVEQVSASCTAGAWARGYLVFENANLGEVIQAIERYRKGAVIFKNPSLSKLKVSGRFDIRHPDNTLTALGQTLPIKLYRLSAWLIVIA